VVPLARRCLNANDIQTIVRRLNSSYNGISLDQVIAIIEQTERFTMNLHDMAAAINRVSNIGIAVQNITNRYIQNESTIVLSIRSIHTNENISQALGIVM
jgi:MinD superfamily P-loop ATPase